MAYSLEKTSDSTALPISLIDAKQHLRVDIAADDEYIASLINVARLQYEWENNRVLGQATWVYRQDRFPEGRQICIPLTPMISLTSITYVDANSSVQTLGSSTYTVDTASETPRIELNDGFQWPTTDPVVNAVVVTMEMGTTGSRDDFPEDAKHWMRLYIAHLYENRSPVEVGQGVPFEVPHTLKRLGRRVVRF